MNLPPAMNSKPVPPSAIRDRQSEISAAFTRAELLVTLAVLSLLVAIVLPALAHDRARSARIICANNLRQIGAGFQLWGNDHGDQPPWEVTPAEGGTKLHPLGVNAWLHFAWISNELNSARVLLCPSDSGRLADDFSFNPVGGYLNANYQNNATSYFLSHSGGIGLVSLLVGDRNVGSDGAAGCGRFGQGWNIRTRPLSVNFQWNSALHNSAGNLLRSDGSIEQSSNQDLDALLKSVRDDSGVFHLLKPR